MSLRISLLLLVVAYLSGYAWRNWFVSVCGAVLLMAVVQHPDFPNSIGGIQGLNPWNILLMSILLAWLARRKSEGLVWDLPPRARKLLIGFVIVIGVGVARFIASAPADYTLGTILSENLINSVKWMVPGLLLFDACRTRRRVVAALIVVLLLYLLLAVQVFRWMPLSYAVSGDDLSTRAAKTIEREIGYNRVNLSMMLAGASWAVLCTLVMIRRNLHRIAVVGAAVMLALAQALTAGRTGYVTWACVGIALSVVRWRKLLPFIPLTIVCLGIALPGVRERMFQGFGERKGSTVSAASLHEITSGRNLAWPRVIEEIKKAPLLGYGRQAMVTTGLQDEIWSDLHESFPHPHQAYLELLLDNGIIGFLLVISFYLFALRRSFELVRDRSDPVVCAVGCAAFSLIFALMIGSFGGQTFYPREGAVGMWAAIGIMLRVYVQRERSLELGSPVFHDDELEQDIAPAVAFGETEQYSLDQSLSQRRSAQLLEPDDLSNFW